MSSGESKLTITGDLRLVAAKVHSSIHEAKVGSPMEHVQVYRDTSLQDLWHNRQHVCEPQENKMITLGEPRVTTTDRWFSSKAPPLPAEMFLNGAWTLNYLHEAIKNHTSVGYCGVCECAREGSGCGAMLVTSVFPYLHCGTRGEPRPIRRTTQTNTPSPSEVSPATHGTSLD